MHTRGVDTSLADLERRELERSSVVVAPPWLARGTWFATSAPEGTP